MPSPFTWDLTKPAGADALSIGDDQIRTDKTSLRDVLRTLVPYGAPTTGWRVIQIDNDQYIVHNAKYDGANWSHDDTGVDAVGVRLTAGRAQYIYRIQSGTTWATAAWIVVGMGGVLSSDASSTNVNNTGVETTTFTFTVPGGTLRTDRALQLRAIWHVKWNAAGTLTVRVKYGTTTIFTSSALDPADSATFRPLLLDVTLFAANATGLQHARAELSIGEVGIAGVGTVPTRQEVASYASAAEDSTLDKAFVVTAQWSVADLNLDLDARNHLLELI